MPLAFNDWKQLLIESAGSASPPVRRLGDYVLRLFWQDGCEPTVSAMLDYAQVGLCRKLDIRVAARDALWPYDST
jgi:hypothetical protein